MRSKKDDIKRRRIENWNRQQSPRVRPVAKQIEIVKAERKMDEARQKIEYRRTTSERDQLIAQGLIKPTKEK